MANKNSDWVRVEFKWCAHIHDMNQIKQHLCECLSVAKKKKTAEKQINEAFDSGDWVLFVKCSIEFSNRVEVREPGSESENNLPHISLIFF